MIKKLAHSVALATAMAFAWTGCPHKPYDVTAIPPPRSAITDYNPNTIPSPPPVQYSQPVTEQPVMEKPFTMSDWAPVPGALDAETIHFSFDSAVIRDSERTKLQAVAAALSSDKIANVMIEGNCDERGTEEYNRSLGERRAEAAREALVSLGVDENRIHTTSYGKDKPVDPGHDAAAWSHNRRDDFVLLHPKTGA